MFLCFVFFLALTGNTQMSHLTWHNVLFVPQPLAQAGQAGRAGLALWELGQLKSSRVAALWDAHLSPSAAAAGLSCACLEC